MPKKLSSGPAWLNYSYLRNQHEFDAEKAASIERIFRETAAGIGAYVLAARLNHDGVPPIGTAPRWIPSSISKILQNRAVLGEYQPRERINGRYIDSGPVEPKFYPRIIDNQLFEAAREGTRTNAIKNKGRKGANFSNLFSGLLFCGHCRERIKFENDGAGRLSLICRQYSKQKLCSPNRWDYQVFEKQFLQSLKIDTLKGPEILSVFGGQDDANWSDNYISRADLNRRLKMFIDRIWLLSDCLMHAFTDTPAAAAGKNRFARVDFREDVPAIFRFE